MKTTIIALLFLAPVATFATGSTQTTYPVKDKTVTTYDKTKTTTTYDKTTKYTGTTMTDSERQQEMIRLQNLIAQLLQQLIALLQAQQKTLTQ